MSNVKRQMSKVEAGLGGGGPGWVGRLAVVCEVGWGGAWGARANARTFGGEDYIWFHTMMALGPAYLMSRELPEVLAPLPVMKVLYRNTNRIAEHGGRASEVLHPVSAESSEQSLSGEAL